MPLFVTDCPQPYTTSELIDALDSAEQNFKKQDASAFAASEAIVATRLRCLTEPLVPDVLSRVYLTEALQAFLAKDDAPTASALASMAASNPGYQLSLALIPDGHPLRAAMTSASLLIRDPVTVPLQKIEVGWIEVDGTHRTDAPTNRDVILQRFDGAGVITETQYIHAGEPLTGWTTPANAPAPPIAALSASPPLPPTPATTHPRIALRGSFALVSGGLGYATPDTSAGPDLSGPGARAAVGLELGTGVFGAFAEAGWLGLTNLGDTSGSPASSHGALLAAGGQLRIGTVTVEAGPAWEVSAVHAENVDCPTTGCGGEASSGTATADGLLFSGGAVLAVDVRLGGPESMFALELEGGALSDLTRPTYWGGLGVRVGNRWAASQ